jgi:outer membrane protein assembly factor BamB
VLWIGLCLPLGGSLGGQEWARFRGPNGSGQAAPADIPSTWTERDYKWRVELAGEGHSSPVLWGDRLYATSADEGATQHVYCLDAGSGRTVWQKRFACKACPKNTLNAFAASTPAVDAHRLYVAWATRECYILVALGRQDGREAWRRDFGPFEGEHGFGASPIVYEDLVIVPNDQDGRSSLMAVDGASGQTRWSVPRRSRKAGYSTPILYTPPGGRPQLITSTWAHGLSSLDPETGVLLWELGVLDHRTVGSPLAAAGLIFAACGEGGSGKKMVAIRPSDPNKKTEAAVAYPITGKLPYVVTPVARGNLLFLWADQGTVTCLDAPTGKRLWQERVPRSFFGSPVCVGDRLYAISRDGKAVVLAAAERYKLLGEVDLGEPSQSTPAVAGGVLYLRTRSHVMALAGR